MFKYFAFAALFAIATAAPGFIAQPVVAKVGAVIHTVPSATSHQSITQVHNNAHIVTPIVKAVAVAVAVVHHVPVVKAVAPVVPVDLLDSCGSSCQNILRTSGTPCSSC